MMIAEVLLYGIGGLAAAEILTMLLVHGLKRRCAWLITNDDRLPKVSASGIESFLQHGWDPELGWIRKPNTRKTEVGLNGTKTHYEIDETGARVNPARRSPSGHPRAKPARSRTWGC